MKRVMGRKRWTSRLTVEECLCLSAFRLRKDGVFSSSFNSDWEYHWTGENSDAAVRFTVIEAPGCPLALALDYVVGDPLSGTADRRRYLIKTTTTLCNYGGRRFWFRCPIVVDDVACNRRVGTLFLPPSGAVFGCRYCYNLTYRCSQTHDPRISKLVNNPALLEQYLKSPSPRRALLALDAKCVLQRRLLEHVNYHD